MMTTTKPTRSQTRQAVVTLALVGALDGMGGLAGQVTEPVVYDVEGVRVVQVTIPGRSLMAAHLYLLGGARQLTPATSGIESLILNTSEYGTEGFPGEAVHEEQVSTGGRFFVRTTADWSVIGFTGLVEDFDRSWAVLSDRVTHPSLDSSSLEIIRNQALRSVRARTDDPDDAVRMLAEQLAFEGHPYAVDVDGTEESLSRLTVDDLRAYHDEHFVRSRILLSVVGAIERPAIESAIRSTLGTLPVGSYTWQLPPSWAKATPALRVEARSLPTNYVLGYFGGPTSAHEHYPAFQVAVRILAGSVSDEIRARGLSYSAGAQMVDRGAAGGGVYVSTVDPEESMRIVNDAISMFRASTIPRYQLRRYATRSSLEYYLANQTSSQQAEFLASSVLFRGRPQSVADWVQDLRGVAGNEVRRMFNVYIKNIQYAFLGQPHLVPRARMLRY